MNILIVDDEPMAVQRLAQMIESIQGCRNIGSASTGLEAIEKTQSLPVDLVLMDIHLPGMSGIQAAQQIRKLANPPAIVITSAHSEYMLAAFSIPASGYLLKPVTVEQLSRVIYNAQSLMNQVVHEALPDARTMSRKAICCKHRGHYELLPLQKVYYLQAIKKQTLIFHEGGYSITQQSLKKLLMQFPESFLQIHRNMIINRSQLKNLQRTSKDKKHLVSLFGVQKLLKVSRRNLPVVRTYLKKIFGKKLR